MLIMLDIRAEIKSFIARNGTSLNKVIKALNDRQTLTTGVSNISLKMKKGTITFNEAQNFLGTHVLRRNRPKEVIL